MDLQTLVRLDIHRSQRMIPFNKDSKVQNTMFYIVCVWCNIKRRGERLEEWCLKCADIPQGKEEHLFCLVFWRAQMKYMNSLLRKAPSPLYLYDKICS